MQKVNVVTLKKKKSSFMLYLIGGVNTHTALISVIVAPKLPW